jgi:acyl CoA:acetate/3-ketoacid CoA transferase
LVVLRKKGMLEQSSSMPFFMVQPVSDIIACLFYVTNVGVFKLTEKGMTLIEVMPGVDIQKELVEACPMRIFLSEEIPVTPAEIVTGKGFRLKWSIM